MTDNYKILCLWENYIRPQSQVLDTYTRDINVENTKCGDQNKKSPKNQYTHNFHKYCFIIMFIAIVCKN